MPSEIFQVVYQTLCFAIIDGVKCHMIAGIYQIAGNIPLPHGNPEFRQTADISLVIEFVIYDCQRYVFSSGETFDYVNIIFREKREISFIPKTR